MHTRGHWGQGLSLARAAAKNPRPLPPAEGIPGAYFAVDYLTAAAKALLDGAPPIDAAGKDVVIVGGGDTGNDCVGAAIRQGWPVRNSTPSAAISSTRR